MYSQKGKQQQIKRKKAITMMVLDKKEMKFEELNSVVGGNAVGPVNKTGPLGTGQSTIPTNRRPAR